MWTDDCAQRPSTSFNNWVESFSLIPKSEYWGVTPSDFEELNTYKSICPKLSCKGTGQNSVRKTESSPWKTASISNSIYGYTVCGRNEFSSSNPPSEAQSRDGFNVTGRYSGNFRCHEGFPKKKKTISSSNPTFEGQTWAGFNVWQGDIQVLRNVTKAFRSK